MVQSVETAQDAIKKAKAVFIKQMVAELTEFQEGLPDMPPGEFHLALANFFDGCDPRDVQ